MHYISNLLTLIEVLFHFSLTVIFAIGNQKFIKKRVNPLNTSKITYSDVH